MQLPIIAQLILGKAGKTAIRGPLYPTASANLKEKCDHQSNSSMIYKNIKSHFYPCINDSAFTKNNQEQTSSSTYSYKFCHFHSPDNERTTKKIKILNIIDKAP